MQVWELQGLASKEVGLGAGSDLTPSGPGQGVAHGWFVVGRIGPSPSEHKEKARARRAFFFFHSISSEYQVQTDLLPDFGWYFGVEVVLYQALLLSYRGGGA